MFGYDQAVTAQYPEVRAGVIHATGLSNAPSPPDLLAEYQAEQQAAAARLAASPIAVIDQGNIAGRITVRFATGTEQFADLGSSGSVFPDPGEVIFTDDANVVAARRWCWRQSAGSATSATTTDALIVIEGQHECAPHDIAAALADLTALLGRYQPRARLTSSQL